MKTAIVVLALLAATTARAGPFFMGLGDFEGGGYESRAYSVSGDGTTIVGFGTTAAGQAAFRWTIAEGLQSLGHLEGSATRSWSFDVSHDGSVIVGFSDLTTGSEAFRWTAETGMQGLGDLPGGEQNSVAIGVSASGSTVVGHSSSALGPREEAFRWTAADGMAPLGDLPGGQYFSQANAASGDGSVIVGFSDSFLGQEIFRWTETDGMQGLGYRGGAHDLTTDGATIVGFSVDVEGGGFRWTDELGFLPIGARDPSMVSADGSVIVGQTAFSSNENSAFIWTEADGVQALDRVLAALGLDLTGWRLDQAWGVSDDGLTVVGTGVNPDGNAEAFLALIPEPNTAVLVGLGLTGLAAPVEEARGTPVKTSTK